MSTLTPVTPLPRDLKKGAETLGRDEARFLVDTYYQMQDYRLSSRNQERALTKSEEPHETLQFYGDQFAMLESQIKGSLQAYAEADPLGAWCLAQYGIGPVITAGLLAHIDLERAPTVGHIWSFAGLEPKVKWEKGQRRPWNADLKTLCWKIGDSFVKFSGREECYYGAVYRKRKEYELERDAQVRLAPPHARDLPDGYVEIAGTWYVGGNAAYAKHMLDTRNWKDKPTIAIYQSGHLPAGQLENRARRYTTKLFLAHYHEAGYRLVLKQDPPLPYPIAHLGHAHHIPAPGL